MNSKTKRRGLLTAALVIAGSVLVATSAGAVLPGSTFEGNDGNFVVNTAGNTDWVNAPNRVIGTDLASGTGDNSFGQGSKEDNVNVTVVSGSIPNSKADLRRFFTSFETVNDQTFLYLGWTRANESGTTNFDFEINQVAQPNLTTPGPKVLNRTVGDLLINYLFEGGAPTNVTLNLRTWTGTAWSEAVPLTGFSEGAVNAIEVTNPINNETIPIGFFGEAAINLTAAGVFPPDECRAFGSIYVKSRSAVAFNSEIKDFIAPVSIALNNCARIIVNKVTVPSPDLTNTSFPFVASYDPDGFSLLNGGSNDSGELNPGTYSVAETPVPANWALTSATCSDGSDPAAISLQAQETVTCTFTNTLQTGAILIHKDRKHAADGPGDHPHEGVSFTVEGVADPVVTDADGNVCVDGLLFDTYTVTESVPAGYVSADAEQDVVVDNAATCEQDPYVGETVNFDNTPLTNVTVSVDSIIPGGTASIINCGSGDVATGPDGDGSTTVSNLTPTAPAITLTCTITIDP